MTYPPRVFFIDGLILFSLYAIGLLGDCLCYGRPWTFYTLSNSYARAIVDNLVHGLISLFSTLFLFGSARKYLLLFALFAGSFVDIDHFIQVRSLSLHRALNDPSTQRPFLHNSLLLCCLTLIGFLIEHFLCKSEQYTYSIVFLLGWSTHHLRDAQRRGLTFRPLGETSPIEYYLPIMCLTLVLMKFVSIFSVQTSNRLRDSFNV